MWFIKHNQPKFHYSACSGKELIKLKRYTGAPLRWSSLAERLTLLSLSWFGIVYRIRSAIMFNTPCAGSCYKLHHMHSTWDRVPWHEKTSTKSQNFTFSFKFWNGSAINLFFFVDKLLKRIKMECWAVFL